MRLFPILIGLLILAGCQGVSRLAKYGADAFPETFVMNFGSMDPAIGEGDKVTIDKGIYQDNSPERGDIILFDYPRDPSRQFVKRIIGLPQEMVEITNGKLLVNGQELIEPYLGTVQNYEGRWEVGADHYFVLGDDRNNSSDSHTWGLLAAKFIYGKVIAVCDAEDASNCRELEAIEYRLAQ